MEKTINSNLIKPKQIALIGIGVSNLTFLQCLKNSDNVNINIFEQSKVISGRAATRKRGEFFFDNGANYFNALDPRVEKIILKDLKQDDLVIIKNWIYPFDKNFQIDYDQKKAELHNEKTKYTYKSGIRNLAELLKDNVKITYKLNYEREITQIKQLETNEWQIFSKGEDLGIFEYLIFGVPSPNIGRLFNKSEFLENQKDFFLNSAKDLINNSYKKCFSLSLAFEKSEIDYPKFSKFFALINSDRKSPISWVCLENEKNRGNLEMYNKHVILNIQMSSEFTIEHEFTAKEKVTDMIMEDFYKLLPELKNIKINYSDLKFWGHALPSGKLEENLVDDLARRNIYILGDSLIGKGRVDGAMQTAIDLYEKLSPKF